MIVPKYAQLCQDLYSAWKTSPVYESGVNSSVETFYGCHSKIIDSAMRRTYFATIMLYWESNLINPPAPPKSHIRKIRADFLLSYSLSSLGVATTVNCIRLLRFHTAIHTKAKLLPWRGCCNYLRIMKLRREDSRKEILLEGWGGKRGLTPEPQPLAQKRKVDDPAKVDSAAILL